MKKRSCGFSAAVIILSVLLGSCSGSGIPADTASELISDSTVADIIAETSEYTENKAEDTAVSYTAADTTSQAVTGADTQSTSGTQAVYDRTAKYDALVLSDGQTLTGGTYTASGKDQSVLEASGSVVATVTGASLQKLDGKASSADDSSFYGVNAGVRVYGKATVTLKDCEIIANASNATGVFAYDGGTVNISDSVVTVTGGGAGGIQVAGGGTLYASNLTVTTASKAAIRSDRGGGTMTVDGGTYKSTGSSGCPSIYSTADITVKNADCISTNSRAVIIEGKNSVTLENCNLTGNDQSTKEGSVLANVMLYQSMSGDASVGVSTFTMTGGSMKSESGAMFYCTNTSSVINLKKAELTLSKDGTLLTVSEGRWGKEGKNGGSCTFNAEEQKLEGDIKVDSISSLKMTLKNSTFSGAVTGEGDVSVTLTDGSTWSLTADSYIKSFSGNASDVISNGFKLYVNGTALSGTK